MTAEMTRERRAGKMQDRSIGKKSDPNATDKSIWKSLRIAPQRALAAVLLVLAVAGCAVVPPADRPPIVVDANVTVTESGSNAFLVSLLGGTRYRAFTLAGPERLVVDLEGAEWSAADRGNATKNNLVSRMRHGEPKPGVLRIVLDLSGPAEIEDVRVLPGAIFGENRLMVRFREMDRTVAAVKDSTVLPRQEVAGTVGTLRANPGRRNDKGGRPIIVIDAGHGGKDPGAVVRGLTEADINLDVALRVEAELERFGDIDVVLTRSSDTYVELEERRKIAEQVDADAFISIHADANKNTQLAGAHFYIHPTSEAGGDMNSEELARSMMKPLGLKSGLIRRPLRQANFVVLRSRKVPSVLIEIGFLTTNKDWVRLQDAGYRGAMAKGIATGIQEYLVRGRRL